MKPYMSKEEIKARLNRGVGIDIVAQLNGCTVDDIAKAIGITVAPKPIRRGNIVPVLDMTTGRLFESVAQAADYFGYAQATTFIKRFNGTNCALIKGHRLKKVKKRKRGETK